MVYCPSFTTSKIVPFIFGGTIDLCVIAGVSGTSAIMVPPLTVSPGFTVICTSHSFEVSRESTLTPRLIYLPEFLAISLRGRSIPSKILFRIPGPSVTEIASPVAITSSPGFIPVVSS